MVRTLKGRARHYDWGSPTVIPNMLGMTADGKPWAELWLGAHPKTSATVEGIPLDKLIADDPHNSLGPKTLSKFGRLPFLMKVLAVERPLSLQVHPSEDQAQTGFEREQALGIPLDARNRSFRDCFHKPELVCSVTPFEILCGFRDISATLALLDTLAVTELNPIRDILHDNPSPDGIRDVIRWLLKLHKTEVSKVLDPVLKVCAETITKISKTVENKALRRLLATVVDLGNQHPDDAGVIMALLLNHIVLNPGEALFVDTGTPHCYLHGTAIEAMACSDNVLRGGLTNKHTDIDALLDIVNTKPELPEIQKPEKNEITTTYDSRVSDFSLTKVETELDRSTLVAGGPSILLCTDGYVTANGFDLRRGQSAWIDFSEPSIRLTGQGTVFLCFTNS